MDALVVFLVWTAICVAAGAWLNTWLNPRYVSITHFHRCSHEVSEGPEDDDDDDDDDYSDVGGPGVRVIYQESPC